MKKFEIARFRAEKYIALCEKIVKLQIEEGENNV